MIMSEHNIYRYIFKTSWSIIIWSWYWHLGSILGHEGIPTQIESLSRNRTIPKLIRWNFRSSQLYVYQYLITSVIKFIKSISHDIKFMIYLIPIKCDHISFSPILKLSFFLYLPIISHPPLWGFGAEVHPPERLNAPQPGLGSLQLRHGSEASDEICRGLLT